MTGGGHVVVAVNGRDGIAVRHEDGTWERLGFLGCCDEPDMMAVVALPGADHEVLVRSAPLWPLAGTLGASVAFVALAWALRPRATRPQVFGASELPAPSRSRRPSTPRLVAGAALMTVAVLWLLAALRVPAVAPGQVDGIAAAVDGVVLAGPPVLAVGALAASGLLPRSVTLRAAGWAFACGVVSAIAVAVLG
jgi:hypothetical protein